MTIDIVDLAPSCPAQDELNLRANHSDGRLTLRWDPLAARTERAPVQGYETGIRRGGDTGVWTDRRTFLGRNITGAVYGDLDNEVGYQVRVRPINAEGDCEWSTPVSGIPTADRAPKDDIDHHDRFRVVVRRDRPNLDHESERQEFFLESVRGGNVEGASLAIAHGADPDSRIELGRGLEGTALTAAVVLGREDLAVALVEAGADVNALMSQESGQIYDVGRCDIGLDGNGRGHGRWDGQQCRLSAERQVQMRHAGPDRRATAGSFDRGAHAARSAEVERERVAAAEVIPER